MGRSSRWLLGTMLAAAVPVMADFHENFESCHPAKSMDGQNGWQERAYGKHPSVNAVKSDDPANPTVVAQSAGPGDHHIFRKFTAEETSKLNSAQVVLIRIKFRGGATVSLGNFGKYGNSEIDFILAKRLTVRADGKTVSGIDNSTDSPWQEGFLAIIRQPDGQYLLQAAVIPVGRKITELPADPAIASVTLPAQAVKFGKWTAIGLRIDGANQVDDLSVAGYASTAALPVKFTSSTASLVKFSPLLDHLLPPRQAVDLDGLWEAAPAAENSRTEPKNGWQTVLVPDLHSSLFSNAAPVVWFRRNFEIKNLDSAQRYLLCFERVTDGCEVWLNGQAVGGSDDGFFPFRLDATAALRPGTNRLLVRVAGTKATGGALVRPSGWSWFLPLFNGIPYPVHLETAGKITIDDVFVIPRLRPEPSLETRVTLTNRSDRTENLTVEAVAGTTFRHHPAALTLKPGESREIVLRDAWEKPDLWWPHHPHLYNLDLTVKTDARITDAFRQRFGFREIEVKGPDMLLNGVRFMHRRSSIIPYWNLTTAEVQKKQIELLRERGFNGYRLHGGPSLRIVRTADELGWLVSPESAVNEPRGHEVKTEFWPNAEKHIRNMIKTMRNNPSVIYWCLSNEFASYYMKGTVEEKAAVDARLLAFGKMAEKIDPTHIWTCSGDGELGGIGKHGPAPSLSFHYAWQPFKLANQLPNTADWLGRGLKPWQGIVWDKTKPVMLSEDLFQPYALKIPHGMSQWGGDQAYDPEKGVYRTWFEAIRMLAAGYYHDRVAVWNIWGTAESIPNNPLYQLGQPVPDYLLTARELNGNLPSGIAADRTITAYNATLAPLQGTVESVLTMGKREIFRHRQPVTLIPGKTGNITFKLPIPDAKEKTKLSWQVRLEDRAGRQLTAENFSLYAFPAVKPQAPQGCALVSNDPKFLPQTVFSAGRHRYLTAALQQKPLFLLLAGTQLSANEVPLLRQAVENGLRVLWLELPAAGTSPCRIDAGHHAAFAFIRSPGDPAIKGYDGNDLRLWLPRLQISDRTILKPDQGDNDIILDCGGPGGLRHTPLMRLHRGRGYYLLCQLPIISSFGSEPAAPHLLQTMLNSLTSYKRPVPRPAGIAGDENGQLKDILRRNNIPFTEKNDTTPVLLINGRLSFTPNTLSRITSCTDSGGTAIINGVTADTIKDLSRLTGKRINLSPSSSARQLIRQQNPPLLNGLSNDDLFWWTPGEFANLVGPGKSRSQPKGEIMLDGEFITDADSGIIIPVTPAGLAIVPLGKGKLVISAIRWEQFLNTQPVKARRFIATLLHNSGATSETDNQSRDYYPVDLRKIVNRGFWHRSEVAVPAWFGKEKDDMRYFPVNVTGIDPDLKVPQPPEKFPTDPVNYAGIDFQLIDPETNHGRSCLIIEPKKQISIPLRGKAEAIWLLGALDGMAPAGQPAAEFVIKYSDNSVASVPVIAGVHLNGYQYYSEVSRGLCAWTGRTPSYKDAVLWSWNVINPKPEKEITGLSIKNGKNALGIIAVSLEVRSR